MLRFKLTFIKTKYSGESLNANLSTVVLSRYLSYLVNGSVETMATSFQVEFIEISVIKFSVFSGDSITVCADCLIFADICSIPVL